MKTSEVGLSLIRKWEGLRLKPYKDAVGIPTIGYGHVMTKFERVKWFNGITKDQAEQLLIQDVAKRDGQLNELIPDGFLNQNQWDAVSCFVFNVGVLAFAASTMLKFIKTKSYKLVAGQFKRWVLAGGQKLPGLVSRRAEEAALFQKVQ